MASSGMGVVRRVGAGAMCAALLAFSGGVAALTETEPNDSRAGAQTFANVAGNFFIDGDRFFSNTSDDFFSFSVRGSGLLRIVASSADMGADSVMGLYDAGGQLVASNDDGAGTGGLSVIEYSVAGGQTGLFTIGFSGYNPGLLACSGTTTACYDTNDDFVFDTFVAGGGAGGSAGWDYRLSLSGVALVPEPHAALLFVPGALLLLGLRKRRRR